MHSIEEHLKEAEAAERERRAWVMGRMRWWIVVVVLVGGVGYLLGRQSLPELQQRFDPETPHEAYAAKLERAGLDGAALGRLWSRAAERALTEAPEVDAPFRETGYLDSSRPDAVAYRFTAEGGQQLTFGVRLEPATNATVFLDLFRAGSGDRDPVHVASADSGALTLTHTPRRDGEFILRVQPELLRGGRYVLSATLQPSLAFPVLDHGPGNIQSWWGDPRAGGRRQHHGIDIFARRGTPVVASAAGEVRGVRETPLGGRVVWLRDEVGRQSIYYAHLEEQLVESGMRVEPGDTLGLVGNSGNARTTPPHLHFGVYQWGNGPTDPLPFVRPLPTELPALFEAEPGEWRRVAVDGLRLRAGPGRNAPELDSLAVQVPLRVLAVAGSWLRVEVPDGRRGYVAGRLTESTEPLRSAAVAADAPLREAPDPVAPEVGRVAPGDRVDVLGQLGDHLYVRSGSRNAWLPRSAAE